MNECIINIKKTLLLVGVILSGLSIKAQTTQIDSGSIIIDMGVVPQTIANGLKPYGLAYALMAIETPVIWSIKSTKLKDSVDFIHNGKSYSGGPFIINADQRTPIVDSILGVWELKGVELDTTVSAFFAPLYLIINRTMNWTLDQQNGAIAADYFLNAEIPSSAFSYKVPDSLGICDQIFIMPHADPTWTVHKNLLKWNSPLDSGGSAGTIWVACHAVSELENLVNPSDSNQKMNFLMQNAVAPDSTPAIEFGNHTDPAFPPAPKFAYPGENVMQFIGDPTPAMLNGSEQVFLPTAGWRPTTKIAIWDDNHPDTISSDPKHRAALFAYGYAFGDTTRGQIFYQSGHDHDRSKKGSPSVAEKVNAQRAMFNFSFLTITQQQASINPITYIDSCHQYAVIGASGPASSRFLYTWNMPGADTILRSGSNLKGPFNVMYSQQGSYPVYLNVVDTTGSGCLFSDSALVDLPCVVLPVELALFNAAYSDISYSEIYVNWITLIERDIKAYQVQWSINNTTFNTGNAIDPIGTHGSNNYFNSFTLPEEEMGNEIYVRLLELTHNGETNIISNTILLDGYKLDNFIIYPVPSQTARPITLAGLSRGSKRITIINQNGAVVFANTLEVNNSKLTIDNLNLPEGIYTISVGEKRKKLILIN